MSEKKIALFAGHNYYPEGGVGDFRGFFQTVDNAQRAFIASAVDIAGDSYIDNWGQIVDPSTMEVLYMGYVGYTGDYLTPGEPKWWRLDQPDDQHWPDAEVPDLSPLEGERDTITILNSGQSNSERAWSHKGLWVEGQYTGDLAAMEPQDKPATATVSEPLRG